METYVRLSCPECGKRWQDSPNDLPSADENFHCPECDVDRRLAEFARTDHDLQNLKQF